jgi:hypothetical protein
MILLPPLMLAVTVSGLEFEETEYPDPSPPETVTLAVLFLWTETTF